MMMSFIVSRFVYFVHAVFAYSHMTGVGIFVFFLYGFSLLQDVAKG